MTFSAVREYDFKSNELWNIGWKYCHTDILSKCLDDKCNIKITYFVPRFVVPYHQMQWASSYFGVRNEVRRMQSRNTKQTPRIKTPPSQMLNQSYNACFPISSTFVEDSYLEELKLWRIISNINIQEQYQVVTWSMPVIWTCFFSHYFYFQVYLYISNFLKLQNYI